MVESLSLTQEILGSNPAIFLFDFNFLLSLNSANSVKAFRENSNVFVMSPKITIYLCSGSLVLYKWLEVKCRICITLINSFIYLHSIENQRGPTNLVTDGILGTLP